MDQANPKSTEQKTVEQSASGLSAAILQQFKLCSQLSSIDLSTMSAMNQSVEAFHAALHERVQTLLHSARSTQRHANASRPFSAQMATLLQKANQLESIIDRLDQYTAKQEASLSKHL